jgi:hypothetical protein
VTQLVFLSVCDFVYDSGETKVRTISGAAMAFAFAGFILSALDGIFD